MSENLNTTRSAGVAQGVIDYYERKLIENAKPEMVHGRDAQRRSLPEHNGRHVVFRRMIPFEASTTPLSEGVTPAGQELRQSTLSCMVKPYGRHVEITDELDLVHLDNMHRETAQLLADQAALSLDTICRDALHAGLNVQYAGGRTARSALTAADKLTAAEVKKAVRTLKRANCRPFADGYYHAIVHPDAVYDLTADPQWIDVAKYQDKSRIERYELGCLYRVRFFESTNAMQYRAAQYVCGTSASLSIASVSGSCAVLSAALTADEARELTGRAVLVRHTHSGAQVNTPMCVERAEGTQVFFRWMPDASVSAGWTAANNARIVPDGGGAEGVNVFGTLIYGQNAFGCVELGGNGGNVKIIMNPPGSGGAMDPLEQRGTIAWKVRGFCCTILQDAFLVRVEHTATA